MEDIAAYFSALRRVCQARAADEGAGYHAAFVALQQVGVHQANHVARNGENITKNRYRNILPYDSWRVVLEDCIEGDYINASWCAGARGDRQYIASQAPIPSTFEAFWWMIWKNDVSTVVMLSKEIEGDKLKCHRYWPDDFKENQYGEIAIQHLETTNFAFHLIRTFTIRNVYDSSKPSKRISQFCFAAWPDHGVPLGVQEFMQFLNEVRIDHKGGATTPLLVHCSAGVGRTGAFIACDRVWDLVENQQFESIDQHIADIRLRRPYMVQTVSQFVFVHNVALHVLKYEFHRMKELRQVQYDEEQLKQAAQDEEELEQEDIQENEEVQMLIGSHKIQIADGSPSEELQNAESAWTQGEYNTKEELSSIESRFHALKSMGVDMSLANVSEIVRLVADAKRRKLEEQQKTLQDQEKAMLARKQEEQKHIAEKKQTEKAATKRRASDKAAKFLGKMK